MSGDFEMSYHSIRIAGKKIETYDDFEYTMLSANKDFFEEIFHKYKEPSKEMIQDIVEKICPKQSMIDNDESRFNMVMLYGFQQRSFLHCFMKTFEDTYNLIDFCELWNKYAGKIALGDDRYCFTLLNVNKNENEKWIAY